MSGGRYDYGYEKVSELSYDIEEVGGCSAATPELRRKFKEHLKLVAQACRAIEWNDSGDGDADEEKLILACLGRDEKD